MNYNLPKSVEIDGNEYPITNNGDYRMVLDVICVLNDDLLDEQERAYCALAIFYGFELPNNLQEAISQMLLFINCGEVDSGTAKDPIMNWEKDFNLYISPINKVLGVECRSVDYMHWWTFVGGYKEIGECAFSNVVAIRAKLRDGKKLDDSERKYYNENRHIVDLKPQKDDEWLTDL